MRAKAKAPGSGNAAYAAQAQRVTARARGMAAVKREIGVAREALCKSLSEDGDPRLITHLGVPSAPGATRHAKIKPSA